MHAACRGAAQLTGLLWCEMPTAERAVHAWLGAEPGYWDGEYRGFDASRDEAGFWPQMHADGRRCCVVLALPGVSNC